MCFYSKVYERLTFFRGASGSAGHTSWSAKPELGDYVSFYVFMIHYLNGLVSGNGRHSLDIEQQLSTRPSASGGHHFIKPRSARLILAGYSYGSMIASHLPGVECVVRLFASAANDSAESEIQLRASHLSSQTLKELEARQERNHDRRSLRLQASQSNLGSSHSSSLITVGGFESQAAEQRIDRQSRRSLDVRKSLDRVRDKVHARPHRLPDSSTGSEGETKADLKPNVLPPQICYLLISPILPPIATFATFFSSLSFKGRQTEKPVSSNDASHELAGCSSLAVYGSKDSFTSVKKLRIWAQELSRKPRSAFRCHEVDGAGHFWHETGVLEQMKNHIKEWESSL